MYNALPPQTDIPIHQLKENLVNWHTEVFAMWQRLIHVAVSTYKPSPLTNIDKYW